ncbi:dTDP-4-dehydrorhamnose 3,5-epimerase [soil metagenome]
MIATSLTELPGVMIVEPRIFADERGRFVETYREDAYREIGIAVAFVQDNFSSSIRGTLRGLHFQLAHPQGKLVMVTRGEIFDVAVDIRRGSPTFRRWVGIRLSAASARQIWIPPGFAHGFAALSETADVVYKVTAPYVGDDQHGVIWNDRELGITWPIEEPLLSPRDRIAPSLACAQLPEMT